LRSGPLRRLPGPESGLSVPTGQVSLARTRAGWSLSGLEGVPERLSSHLAMLAPPLQFHAAGLRAGSEGHYLVTVLGRLEADMGDRPFSYRRALRRPRPPMVAEPVGQAAIAGADVSPLTATLDTTIVEGAEAGSMRPCQP
jgi:hypothetical protein